MTYRETSDATRAERDQLVRELDDAHRDHAQLESKLARAESALSAYRRGLRHPDLAPNFTPIVVFLVCSLVYAGGVISAMQDHDDLATHLAFASVIFSALAPLAAWASAQRLLAGASAWVVKLLFSVFIVGTITSRRPVQDESFLLFWWAPAVVLFCATLELTGLWLLTRGSTHESDPNA